MPSYTPKLITLEEEYAKDIGITPADIARFREWLKTQPHLPGDMITDLDLILTYHCCDRSMEVSKQVLDLNITLRTLFTNFFKDRTVDAKIEQVMKTGLMAPLKMRARDGSAVVYARLLDYEPKNFMFGDSIRGVLMLHDVWQLEEGTWPGLIMIFDLEGMKFGHLSRLGLTDVQQFLYYLQEAMLVKLKGLHYLNAPSFMDRFLMILRPFLKKDLLEALHVHQVGSTTIDKWLDMKALPKEAGGEYKTFNELQEETQERVRSHEQYFQLENKKRVRESARPGKPKTISDLFHGIEGSFKKLNID